MTSANMVSRARVALPVLVDIRDDDHHFDAGDRQCQDERTDGFAQRFSQPLGVPHHCERGEEHCEDEPRQHE
jgi:hypothetical protein